MSRRRYLSSIQPSGTLHRDFVKDVLCAGAAKARAVAREITDRASSSRTRSGTPLIVIRTGTHSYGALRKRI